VNWRRDTLKGTVSESFGDYFKRCQASFVAEQAFLEKYYKVANETERAALLAEKYGLTK
jgi:hypothetical protein